MLRAVLLIVALVGVSVPAQAAMIPIGELVFTPLDMDAQGNVISGTFSVVNQTGPDSTNAFPITTLLTFDTLSLTIDANAPLAKSDLTANLNSLDTGLYSPLPTLATLTGSIVLPVGPVLLVSTGAGSTPAWNGLFNITSATLFGNPDPISVSPFANPFGDTHLIYVDAEQINTVPEPMTLTLVGTGLAGAMLRRRRAQRVSSN